MKDRLQQFDGHKDLPGLRCIWDTSHLSACLLYYNAQQPLRRIRRMINDLREARHDRFDRRTRQASITKSTVLHYAR